MKTIFTIFSIILILFIWSVFIEPNVFRITRYKITDADLEGLRVVFAADFHYKPYEKWRLERDVRTINAQNPDIVLFGGDYVNGHKKGFTLPIDEISAEFSKIKSKYGVYAVLGNHDGWHDEDGITKSLEANGIKILKNSSELVKAAKPFYIAGVEDMQTGNPDTQKALAGTSGSVILLSHTPDIIESVPAGVKLVLAGHLHGGQVVIPRHGPLVAPSKFGTKYASGFFDENGKKLIVTKGLGTSILPLRFHCMPEIVLIEFIGRNPL